MPESQASTWKSHDDWLDSDIFEESIQRIYGDNSGLSPRQNKEIHENVFCNPWSWGCEANCDLDFNIINVQSNYSYYNFSEISADDYGNFLELHLQSKCREYIDIFTKQQNQAQQMLEEHDYAIKILEDVSSLMYMLYKALQSEDRYKDIAFAIINFAKLRSNKSFVVCTMEKKIYQRFQDRKSVV